MDRRDYFAGQALAGLLARSGESPATMAAAAFEFADAMVKLSRSEPPARTPADAPTSGAAIRKDAVPAAPSYDGRCRACQGQGGYESARRGWIPCEACGGKGS